MKELGTMEVRRGEIQYDVPLVDGAMVIGRDARLALCLNDPSVSRRHAVLVVSRQVVELHDLGALNGVQINGQPLARLGRAALQDGDRLDVGGTELVYRRAPVPAAASAALNGAPAAPPTLPLPPLPVTPAAFVPPRAAIRERSARQLLLAAVDVAPRWFAPAVIGGGLLVAVVLAGAVGAVVATRVARGPDPAPGVVRTPMQGAAPAVVTSAVPQSGAVIEARDAARTASPAELTSASVAASTSEAPPAMPSEVAAAPPLGASTVASDVAAVSTAHVAQAPREPEGDAAAVTARAETDSPPPDATVAAPGDDSPRRSELAALGARLLGRELEQAEAAALTTLGAPEQTAWFLARPELAAHAWAQEVEHQGLTGALAPATAEPGDDPLAALSRLVLSPAWARRHLGSLAMPRAVFERVLDGPSRTVAPGPEWHAAQRACEGHEAELLGGRARHARELLRLALDHPRAREGLLARMAARALGRPATDAELGTLRDTLSDQGWFPALVRLACSAELGG